MKYNEEAEDSSRLMAIRTKNCVTSFAEKESGSR